MRDHGQEHRETAKAPDYSSVGGLPLLWRTPKQKSVLALTCREDYDTLYGQLVYGKIYETPVAPLIL